MQSQEQTYKSPRKDDCAFESQAEDLFPEGVITIWSFAKRQRVVKADDKSHQGTQGFSVSQRDQQYEFRSNLRKLIQKQNLQVSCSECVKTPPSEGPMTEDIPYMLETIAKSSGRFLTSTIRDMMIIEPQNIPAAPSPAIALPTMNAGELGAAAQSTDPPSKIIEDARYTHLRLKKV